MMTLIKTVSWTALALAAIVVLFVVAATINGIIVG